MTVESWRKPNVTLQKCGQVVTEWNLNVVRSRAINNSEKTVIKKKSYWTFWETTVFKEPFVDKQNKSCLHQYLPKLIWRLYSNCNIYHRRGQGAMVAQILSITYLVISSQKKFWAGYATDIYHFGAVVENLARWFYAKAEFVSVGYYKDCNTCKQSFYKWIIEFVLGTLYPRINFTSGVGR